MDHPAEVQQKADELYERYDPESRGKRPSVTRAAAVYLAYMMTGRKDEITQKQIADAYDTHRTTMRKRVRQINDSLGLQG